MQRAILIVGLVLVGCGGYGNDENYNTTTSRTTVTAAEVRADQRTASDRIGEAICAHEVECGRPQQNVCLSGQSERAAAELGVWECAPGAYRTSTQECLASIRAESCNVDLVSRRNVCPLNSACRRGEASTKMIPPGRASAEMWRE